MTILTWLPDAKYGHIECWARECCVTIEPRPFYCDRGNYIAKVHAHGGTQLAMDMDAQDGWPRYYMDLERAKLEIEDWLRKRGQHD